MMQYQPGNFGFIPTDCIAKQSLSINDLGVEYRKSEDYRYENSSRGEYQGYVLQYTLDGYGIYENQGILYKLTKGKAFLIEFPEESQYYLPSDDSDENHWTFFYLHFSGPAVEPFFTRIRELSGPIIELGVDSLPISLFFELYEALHHQKQLERYIGSEWLYRFLISLLRNVEFPSTRKLSPHVASAIDWMKRNYTKQVNLEELHQEIGVSYSHLTRQFCKEQGISPVQFLTHIRLEQGMKLLLGTNLSIDEIAEACGFSSANYFIKVYKKVLHTTPGEYRRQRKFS
jgi:AraC-like DNA-binding protein